MVKFHKVLYLMALKNVALILPDVARLPLEKLSVPITYLCTSYRSSCNHQCLFVVGNHGYDDGNYINSITLDLTNNV